mmetsp:Transcript_7069/g.21550  ORF Transcript_7069/g.21550 Transcript_7069/m.21550 type:complete len:297 (-) Transcript_7069:381-1271(-)
MHFGDHSGRNSIGQRTQLPATGELIQSLHHTSVEFDLLHVAQHRRHPTQQLGSVALLLSIGALLLAFHVQIGIHAEESLSLCVEHRLCALVHGRERLYVASARLDQVGVPSGPGTIRVRSLVHLDAHRATTPTPVLRDRELRQAVQCVQVQLHLIQVLAPQQIALREELLLAHAQPPTRLQVVAQVLTLQHWRLRCHLGLCDAMYLERGVSVAGRCCVLTPVAHLREVALQQCSLLWLGQVLVVVLVLVVVAFMVLFFAVDTAKFRLLLLLLGVLLLGICWRGWVLCYLVLLCLVV